MLLRIIYSNINRIRDILWKKSIQSNLSLILKLTVLWSCQYLSDNEFIQHYHTHTNSCIYVLNACVYVWNNEFPTKKKTSNLETLNITYNVVWCLKKYLNLFICFWIGATIIIFFWILYFPFTRIICMMLSLNANDHRVIKYLFTYHLYYIWYVLSGITGLSIILIFIFDPYTVNRQTNKKLKFMQMSYMITVCLSVYYNNLSN